MTTRGSTAPSGRSLPARALVGAGALTALPEMLVRTGFDELAKAAGPDLVVDTLSGLVAFVLPGADAYSVAQGEVTTDPGGIDANVAEVLIAGLDSSFSFRPTLSASVAALLNGIALAVDRSAASGAFASPFANLSFARKAAVLEILERDAAFAPLRPLVGILPGLVASLVPPSQGGPPPAASTSSSQSRPADRPAPGVDSPA